MHDFARGGGVIVLRHTLIKNEWDEMCGEVYTLDALTDRKKIHGVAVDGKAHQPIGGWGGQRGRGSADPY